jgi:hypothetical protein
MNGTAEDAHIYTFNRIFTVFFGVVFILFLIFSIVFLFSPNCGKFYNNIHERLYFNRQFTGSLYRDIMYHKTECLFTPILFIVKRMMFVYSSSFIDSPSLGIASFNIVTFINLLYLVNTVPYQERWMQNLEVFNEIFSLFFVVFLQGILYYMPPKT